MNDWSPTVSKWEDWNLLLWKMELEEVKQRDYILPLCVRETSPVLHGRSEGIKETKSR